MALFDDAGYMKPPQHRDWLDRLRGQLPHLAPPSSFRAGRRPIRALVQTAVGWGLATGAATGAVTAALLFVAGGPFALVAAVPGAIVGFVVAIPLTLVLAGVIPALAMRRHAPPRDPERLHREIWWTFLVTIISLDGPVVGLIVASRSASAKLLGLPAAAIVTLVLLLMLRRAGRRIVISYAEAAGWHQTGLSDQFPGRLPPSRSQGRLGRTPPESS